MFSNNIGSFWNKKYVKVFGIIKIMGGVKIMGEIDKGGRTVICEGSKFAKSLTFGNVFGKTVTICIFVPSADRQITEKVIIKNSFPVFMSNFESAEMGRRVTGRL